MKNTWKKRKPNRLQKLLMEQEREYRNRMRYLAWILRWR